MMIPVAWRDRWWRWALPLAFVIANAVILLIHPGRTGVGFAVIEKDLESESRTLAGLKEKESALKAVLGNARSSHDALRALYREGFSTEAERLTRLITEVKRLGQRAGLKPESINYPEQQLDDYGLVRMSLVFGVQGTYPQLRMLVNLLEHSDLFLVLERVGLNGSDASGTLSISLELSTLFVREREAAERATRSPRT